MKKLSKSKPIKVKVQVRTNDPVVTRKSIEEAAKNIYTVVDKTPLQFNKRLSEKYKANVYLKREDLQVGRSYKIRGAYNRMCALTPEERVRGVVCASAGNHAQGVALSCEVLKINGHIYMPQNTPKQKVERVRILGGKWVTVVLVGDTFDETSGIAKAFCSAEKKMFIHPFDDVKVIAGQGTVAVEIMEQLKTSVDYVLLPVGGGGLISGVGTYLKAVSPKTKIVGVEPLGAPSMQKALEAGKVVTLDKIDKFVDGAAVKTVGQLTFATSQKVIDSMLLVPEGKVCQEMIALYQSDGIITEPAGALSMAALDQVAHEILGKTVVCVVSGGNNDISRYSEIIERSLVYQGLKHYFIIEFSQRPGALRKYLNEALGPHDDITLFEYVKKNNRETGPTLVGIELSKKEDLEPLLKRMNAMNLSYQLLEKDSVLFRFLI